MKKLLYIIAAGALIMSVSCSKLLDTDNMFDKSLETFYKSPQDINEAMGGVYNALYVNGVFSEEHLTANLLSDCMLAGGGPDDVTAKWVDGFEDPLTDTYKDLWVQTYNGVYRANAIIEAVENTDFSSYFYTEDEANTFKTNTIGEAYFMRGFMMYRAARFFGGMPLIPTSDAPRDVPRASFTETFGMIADDFIKAAELLPVISAGTISPEEYGHANKWAAKAYIARTYMFYTGYMTNIEKQSTDVLALSDGGILTKADAVAHLDDIKAQSGYALVSDFRNLWPYSYVNTSAGSVVLPWADDQGLEWVGQDGPNSPIGTGNNEVIFAKRFAFGNWGWDEGPKYNNRVPLFFGIRSNSLVPFAEGWGWGPVHPQLWNQWDDTDPRKEGSILVLGDANQATDGYSSPNNWDHETGYMNKKYVTLQHDGADGNAGMFYYLYSSTNNDMQLWHAQDFYYLRYADILLMHSELTETPDGINEVRARAGLGSVGYTIDNLKAERLYEFAFEGLRWFDLVRWGDVENAGNNFYGTAADVTNSGGVSAVYTMSYRAETKGLLPIPESEVQLSNGLYNQNPGW
ncbi:MAG: RagB/SusD family nutrient uptake outer membrane protein [Bacteroidetes bacterium]|nr:MAG: RagB/SusD family nutrient uptake outer membrane protein [Bacteroidota bacterium]